MAFAIKAEVRNPRATTFEFTAQKTMYGGKHIAEGDTVFVFASENEGGQGLIASGIRRRDREDARRRPANAAREHHRQTHRVREAAAGAKPAQTLCGLE
jgi:hypothetical protein